MPSRQQLIAQIKQKKSFLCVGLDTDIEKIPQHLLDLEDPIYEFNKQIIDATRDLCVSYKPNSAFYEARGLKGLQSLIKTWEYLPKETLNIIDAKRGDIGNTSDMYAKSVFDQAASGVSFDAVTVAPYMGRDSVTSYLKYDGKWVILLGLTSNQSSQDFQLLPVGDGYLFEDVIAKANTWAGADKMMYVVGATKGASFVTIRNHAPDHFLLVPGVGAQGGSLAEVCEYGMNKDCGLIVNASRSIIYASDGKDFADAARAEALSLQQDMELELEKGGVI